MGDIHARFGVLRERVREELESQGIERNQIDYEEFLSIRYEGTDTNITISKPDHGDFGRSFIEQHRRQFAFELERKLVVDSVRIRGVGKGVENHDSEKLFRELEAAQTSPRPIFLSKELKEVYFDGEWIATPMFLLETLELGDNIEVSVTSYFECVDLAYTIRSGTSFDYRQYTNNSCGANLDSFYFVFTRCHSEWPGN